MNESSQIRHKIKETACKLLIQIQQIDCKYKNHDDDSRYAYAALLDDAQALLGDIDSWAWEAEQVDNCECCHGDNSYYSDADTGRDEYAAI